MVRYVRDQMEWDGITLFTDGYINRPVVDQVRSQYKIGWLHEPQCLHPENYENSLANSHKLDFILTYAEELLSLPKYRFAPYGGVWIERQDWGLKPKTKMVSLLSGDKLSTAGHKIRREIADAVLADNPGIDLYGYGGQPVDYSAATKLKALADYRFAIVTETCRENNLFTEWLLDCFAVGTIPIYWGCPNLGKFFEPSGVLSFADLSDVGSIVTQLSVNLYEYLYPAVIENYREVRHYEITEDWISEHVLGYLADD